jgi:site-specific DNA-methyltransferase (adenine-specific)
MSVSRALFSSQTGKWATPSDLYAELDAEFGFTLDPCPMDDAERIFEQDGLLRSWAGERVFCNPPYGNKVGLWLAKAREAEVAVFLLPSRTDVRWFHDYALDADEIRFVKGRLTFGNAKAPAPFPSVVLIYRTPRTGPSTEGGTP